MATITVDGRSYEVDGARNLLHVLLGLGFDLPYFCWHPSLGSVGACRQCAVKQFKDEDDEKGRIVMACMTPAKDGTRISVDDSEAVEFRRSVTEWLMLNHPHDCPVCDEGGECHLQDMTVMTGHDYRRTRFPKRTHRNQDLGPFVNHEMNRCIQCYRCVRYYRDYAGGEDLDVFGAHDHVYFGRREDGVLESEFSGNLVEVCPTGVFTDKTLKQHYTRKWDQQMAPSVCVHCGLGCNVTVGERYGTIRRIVNRYHGEVNGYFLCDRGRFGYGFVDDPARLSAPSLGTGESRRPAPPATALGEAAARLGRCDRLVGIGSPRASLESNLALKELVGDEAFFSGFSRAESGLAGAILDVLRRGPAPVASLREVEDADAVVVLGEDPTWTAPRLALALRQATKAAALARAAELNLDGWDDHAVRNAGFGRRSPFFLATPTATRIDDLATGRLRTPPAEVVRFGHAVAHAVDPEAPAPSGVGDEAAALASEAARALLEAEHPLVVAGAGLGRPEAVEAAANVAWALRRRGRDAKIVLTVPEADTLGAALLGGKDLEAAAQAVEAGGSVGLVVLENDLYRRADAEAVDRLLLAAEAVVLVDHLPSRVADRAQVILPAATFADSDGTLVNNETRAQRFFRARIPEEGVRDGWRWISALGEALGRGPAFADLDDALARLARRVPELAGAREAAPGADARFAGERVARQPDRYSGRTAMHADVAVSEPMQPVDDDAPLAFSMEGYDGQPPASLIPFFHSPGWNSIQSVNKFQEEIAGPLRGGDPGVRLVAADPDARPGYFPARVPELEGDGLLLVPVHLIFGSDPQSAAAPAVAERIPEPYLALRTEDAARLRLSAGDRAEVRVGRASALLTVRIDDGLAEGTAAVPVGLPGQPHLDLPARAVPKGVSGS